MSNTLEKQKSQLQLQLEELVKVGVGGKYVNNSNYNEQITEELQFEESMLRGGIDRYRKNVSNAVRKGQESTTLYGQVFQQKYITKLSECINNSNAAFIFSIFVYLSLPWFFNYDRSNLEKVVCKELNLKCSISCKIRSWFYNHTVTTIWIFNI